MAADAELRWLLELTSIPTAAGREGRVVEWIDRWAAERSDLALTKDQAGNLLISTRDGGVSGSSGQARPLFITAHLDHPAFVVERILGPATLLASFRGGVMDPYFKDAVVRVVRAGSTDCSEQQSVARVTEKTKKEPFPECLIEFDGEGEPAQRFSPGDIAVWDLPDARIEGDLLHAPACDDLAAVAAALATMERLRGTPHAAGVRLLFTRAEEIGFIGAIAACKLGTMPGDARVIALENSRSFAESPIGGGPIVRVGDRLSIFHPGLTGSIAGVAQRLADEAKGHAAPFTWQRRLMPGGACEATVFQAYGYESTCVCLPLGNYHNMADLERVQAGDAAVIAGARVGPEMISVSDYKGMIALLEACAAGLASVEPLAARLEKMYAEKSFVLGEPG